MPFVKSSSSPPSLLSSLAPQEGSASPPGAGSVHSIEELPELSIANQQCEKARGQRPKAHLDSAGWSIWQSNPIALAVYDTANGCKQRARGEPNRARDGRLRRAEFANVIRTADLLDPFQVLHMLSEKRCDAVPSPLV
ncbi:hypothetical protein BWQ96_09469 [Gracilariopsis chorda]|uniref:Uncharacterized protein n=1 Tax=Gracilariopsis chorda TaxID=448386 RepID=A0A2V3IFI2_9FLOR|nr:hypothetical protein BWQ96_09469 [Gracilariopsis chorda]|eukprot:PXF40811.1 hypothetical protein BWQ96_09469 [Gracilariopsis chorda]